MKIDTVGISMNTRLNENLCMHAIDSSRKYHKNRWKKLREDEGDKVGQDLR